jgi:hypothetical protein
VTRLLRTSGAVLLVTTTVLVAAPEQGPQPREVLPGKGVDLRQRIKELDANKDGFLERSEAGPGMKARFDQIDTNKDGKLSFAELEKGRLGKNRKGGRPGEIITPAAKAERHKDSLRVGDVAPNFTLPDKSGKAHVTLSDFRGKKPVVLVFASYT